MPTPYVSTAALKSRITVETQAHENQLSDALDSACRSIEQYCGRIFYQTDAGTVRTFEPDNPYKVKMGGFDDIVSIATLKTDAAGNGTFETTWASSDYQLWPVNPSAAPEQRPYTEIRAVGTRTFPCVYSPTARTDVVQITGVFGWPAVPSGIEEATKILATELFRLKDAPFGVASFGEQGLIRIRENQHLKTLLDPYRRATGTGGATILVA